MWHRQVRRGETPRPRQDQRNQWLKRSMDPDKISMLRITEEQKFVPSSGRRRKFLALIVVAVLAVGSFSLARHFGLLSSSVEVRASSVNWMYPSQVITEFNASGYVVAQRKASVASKGTGRLSHLGVQEGSRVKEGDVLARIENDDLVADRNQSAAQLAAARSELSRSEIELDTAARNHIRFTDLYARKAVAQVDLENARDRYLKAKAAVDSAKSNIRVLEAALRKADVLVEYTVIRAPFDGVVLTKDADVGEVVAPFGSATNAKAAVVNMADLSSLMVQADVAESFLSRVAPGQTCEIQLDSLPDTRFPGTVDIIVPTADRTRGTVMVKVRFDQLDPRILPEMSAKVSFLSRPLREGENRPFLAIHRDALAGRGEEQGVFRIDGDRAVWVALPGVETFGDYALPGSAMKSGDRVVLKPPRELKSGDKIKVAD
jgi:RND family efflux transporter MFP subunit